MNGVDGGVVWSRPTTRPVNETLRLRRSVVLVISHSTCCEEHRLLVFNPDSEQPAPAVRNDVTNFLPDDRVS